MAFLNFFISLNLEWCSFGLGALKPQDVGYGDIENRDKCMTAFQPIWLINVDPNKNTLFACIQVASEQSHRYHTIQLISVVCAFINYIVCTNNGQKTNHQRIVSIQKMRKLSAIVMCINWKYSHQWRVRIVFKQEKWSDYYQILTKIILEAVKNFLARS